MSNSVYSIILNDEIVRAVDRAAYSNGCSRSAMINRILAEHVSYVTPEMQIRSIFRTLEQNLLQGGIFQSLMQPSDSMFAVRSALDFKYNPSVRYGLELYKDSLPLVGELRVSLRTQNETLLRILNDFYSYWILLERSVDPEVRAETQGGRFRRVFLRSSPEGAEAQQLGSSISGYIDALDSAMKLFFSGLAAGAVDTAAVDAVYLNYIRERPVSL